MTVTDAAGAEVAPERPEYQGWVVIEWPPCRVHGPDDPWLRHLPAWAVSITDAMTGQMLTSVCDLAVIRAEASSFVTADLTCLIGMDGLPARQEPRDPVTGKWPPLLLDCDEDDQPKTAVFRYIVAEMKVRQPELAAAAGAAGAQQ